MVNKNKKELVKVNFSPGDLVIVKTAEKEEKGIVMYSPEEKVLMLKLDNGYNIGFNKNDLLDVKLLNKKEDKKEDINLEIVPKKGLKKVTILHCGGTIASKVDYQTGAVAAKFSPHEILGMFPELAQIVNLSSRLVANMMSENMRFAHYNLIAKEIEKEIKNGCDGIIITHGTDTLHYTAASLSFILENLNVPVLLVGAQRSSDRGSSDAFLNLKSATQFIANSEFKGVGICMHANPDDEYCAIIPGLKSRKMHSSRRDAFKAINSSVYALIDSNGKIEWKNKVEVKSIQSKLTLRLFNDKLKIGILKAHPQMYVEEFKAYVKYDGLIIEGTGLGHLPIENYDDYTKEHEKIFQELEKLAKKIPLVMTTQTIFGVVNMNVYSPGRRLLQVGILGNQQDLPAEIAFIKLAWLLSNYPSKVKEMYPLSLRGEISNFRVYEKDFL